eukprot:CAMPEP_0170625806 /NCGR_PEP_ID=MMETSP0224-20130122/30974_1 /TAXON_ID=285029 /ORGANISM="Togula jolla, Strain CCCM 725" /LENGTH=51 /DNA_ID=CAMNT_0010952443 /DNA_START=88 /DNA_END=243 /DNA_ORIENTATION=-
MRSTSSSGVSSSMASRSGRSPSETAKGTCPKERSSNGTSRLRSSKTTIAKE